MAQVQPVIEAAEKAATAIIAEAEAQAAKYVEESRRRTEEIANQRATDMWALTDALIERAEAVKRQSDDLLQALNQTRRGVEAALQAGSGPEPSQVQRLMPVDSVPRGLASPPSPSRFAEPRPAASNSSLGTSEGARLLATQMAVAGSSRVEITKRLRDDFGVDDAEAMLDTILGTG